jgi:hypothetical protein
MGDGVPHTSRVFGKKRCMVHKKRATEPKPNPTMPTVEILRLAVLVDHPAQETYFPHYDERTFDEQVRSIRDKGVETPIDVLPPGTRPGCRRTPSWPVTPARRRHAWPG